MKNKVATFGSATQDIFLQADSQIINSDNFTTGKGVCFPLGSKVDVNDIFFTTGGGGTNTATTFSNQGFETFYIGKVGDDLAGKTVLEVLRDKKVDTSYCKTCYNERTNLSVVLDSKNEDRTILVYRGASEMIKKDDLPENFDANWFYIAPLGNDSVDTFYHILDYAKLKNIKTAVNPSVYQLNDHRFEKALEKIDVLFVNQEEASILTKIDYQNEDQIFAKIDKSYSGIFIMTKGPKGLTLSDNKNIYVAKTPDSIVVDRTGAGDAFGSGFISGLIKFNGDIKEAIWLGIGNATSCLTKKGAKNGLLSIDEKYLKAEIETI